VKINIIDPSTYIQSPLSLRNGRFGLLVILVLNLEFEHSERGTLTNFGVSFDFPHQFLGRVGRRVDAGRRGESGRHCCGGGGGGRLGLGRRRYPRPLLLLWLLRLLLLLLLRWSGSAGFGDGGGDGRNHFDLDGLREADGRGTGRAGSAGWAGRAGGGRENGGEAAVDDLRWQNRIGDGEVEDGPLHFNAVRRLPTTTRWADVRLVNHFALSAAKLRDISLSSDCLGSQGVGLFFCEFPLSFCLCRSRSVESRLRSLRIGERLRVGVGSGSGRCGFRDRVERPQQDVDRIVGIQVCWNCRHDRSLFSAFFRCWKKLSRLLRKLLKSIAVLFYVVFFYGRIFCGFFSYPILVIFLVMIFRVFDDCQQPTDIAEFFFP